MGEECNFQICQPIQGNDFCQINADCRPGELCIANQCESGVECLDDSDCAFPEVCIGNQCAAPGCGTDADCPQGPNCIMGVCI